MVAGLAEGVDASTRERPCMVAAVAAAANLRSVLLQAVRRTTFLKKLAEV